LTVRAGDTKHCKQGAAGSSPATSTNLFNHFVAISAEHLLPQRVFLLRVVSLLPPGGAIYKSLVNHCLKNKVQVGPHRCVAFGSLSSSRRFKSGLRNQNFFAFNHFRKPRSHPNLYAAVEIRESCVSKNSSCISRWA